MTAFQELALFIWLDFNALFVLWMVFRQTARGEMRVAPIKSK